MKFEWDENKNSENKIKHGIAFEEVENVFYDTNAVVFFDEAHSENEDRFIIIGEDIIFRKLTVCHCYRGNDGDIIRIISAREATKREIKLYRRG